MYVPLLNEVHVIVILMSLIAIAMWVCVIAWKQPSSSHFITLLSPHVHHNKKRTRSAFLICFSFFDKFVCARLKSGFWVVVDNTLWLR